MPEPVIRLHVWIQEYNPGDTDRVREIIEESEFYINTSHKPDHRDIEYQTSGFEENDKNLKFIEEVRKELAGEFPNREIERSSGRLRDSLLDGFESIILKPDPNPGLYIENVDLSGTEFSSIDTTSPVNSDIFAGAELAEIDFSETILRNADFSGSVISDSDFSDAYLRESNFSEAIVTATDFSNADFSQADFTRARFQDCIWGGKYELRSMNFANADLSGANFTGRDLRQANLSGANLTDADLSDTRLQGVNLENAILDDTDLSNADLTDTVRFGGGKTNLSNVDFSNSITAGTEFPESYESPE